MRQLAVLFLFSCFANFVYGQLNMELQANITYDDKLSDIWGYTDSNGNEYALVCLRGGLAIENISNPTNPELVAIIEGPRSTWRDAKTYGNFAYIINESSSGIQIINLKNLPNAPDTTDSYFWSPSIPSIGDLTTCHNIYIDPATGYGFIAGCDINNGGVVILDLFTEPGNPIYVAAAAPVYAHDVYTKGNFIYSSDIYAGAFAIQDMTNKDSIFTISSQITPFQFTHNTWVSDDENVIFTTDERSDAPIGAYDISDKNNIKFLDEFRPAGSINEGLIPHNVHVKDGFLITSYYTEGVIITDANRPENLIEVGNYDTYDGANGNFSGVWGAYPFFESGIIIGSDISSGLFVLKPNYKRAAYLEGLITQASDGLPLTNVEVKIISTDPNLDQSDARGEYKTGQVSSGTFEVSFSKPGYKTVIAEATLENGIVNILNIEMELDSSFTSGIPELIGVKELKVAPNPFSEQVQLIYELASLKPNTQLLVRDIFGRLVYQNSVYQSKGRLSIGSDWQAGIYILHLEAEGAISQPIKLIKAN